MSYPTEEIANWFLSQSEPINSMKLNKLLYIAHGWHLALSDKPLINENIVASEYGPHIHSTYHYFKHLGNNPIHYLMMKLKVVDGKLKKTFPQIDENLEENKDLVRFLNRIWDIHSKWSATQLAVITTDDDEENETISPYHQVEEILGEELLNRFIVIPDELIKNYFYRRRIDKKAN